MKAINAFVAVVALLSAPADAFWRMRCPAQNAFTRLDPLVQPGEMARHPHAFVGGSHISDTVTYDNLVNADCTTCEVTADKSLYWVPALMFNNSGPIEPVQQTDFAVYYQLYPEPDKPLTSFPPGFRMLAGDPLLRSNDTKNVPGSDQWTDHQKQQFAIATRSTGFNCIRYDGSPPEATAFRQVLPSKDFIDTCTQLRVEQYFPSCWNGKDLDSPDHRSHMAYPEQVNNGKCPDSHPKRTPVILYETYWEVNQFKGKPGEFMLSNGDPTGWGMHGDFIMGWDSDVLEQAVQTCHSLEGKVEQCPAFAGKLQKVGIEAEKNELTGQVSGQCKLSAKDIIKKVAIGGAKDEDCASGAKTICGNVPVERGPQYATVLGGGANQPIPSVTLGVPDAVQPTGLPKVPDVYKPSDDLKPSSAPKATQARPTPVAPAPNYQPPTPTTAAATQEPQIVEGSVVSTQTRTYTTTGGVVVLELVAIKEVVMYTTVTVPANRRRHVHHLHHRRDLEHGLLGRA